MKRRQIVRYTVADNLLITRRVSVCMLPPGVCIDRMIDICLYSLPACLSLWYGQEVHGLAI